MVVAVIAVLVLGAGGWWVVKTRAEKAEQARIAAEAKAEAERKAAVEKAEAERRAAEETRLAEEKRKAAEEEKARLAAEEKAAAERVNRQVALLRSQLAEVKILWEATEQTARAEERRVAELRSELRDLERQGPAPAAARARAELGAQEQWARWIAESLLRHPARIALVQAEELLAARSPDEAQAALERARAQLLEHELQLKDKRRELFALTTRVMVAPEPATVSWELTDAYGEVHRGQGAREVTDLPFGKSSIRFQLTGYADKRFEFTVARDNNQPLTVTFEAPRITIESIPDGAEVFFNGRTQGKTPLTVDLPAPAKLAVELRKEGYRPVKWDDVQVKEGGRHSYVSLLRNRSAPTVGFGFNRRDDNMLFISGVLDYSPTAKAGLKTGDRIDAVHNGSEFVPVTTLTNFAFLQLMAGKVGEKLRLQVTPQGSTASREVVLERRPLGEIEDAASSFIHYLRGVVLMELNLTRRVEVAGKSWQVGEWNRASVRVSPGRHRLWLEGVGEFYVDVRPGEEVYVRGTMGGFKVLSREEGEALGRKLEHVAGSEYQRPPPVLP